jgi:hypothetical protein
MPVPDVCERAGEGCVVRPMRCGRINALRTGLGLRGPSSAIPDREALRLRTVPRRAPSVWLWFPKAKPCITNANVPTAAPRSVRGSRFSPRHTNTKKRPTRHRTHHITDLEQTSQTGENARRDRVLAYHSLALSLNFTQLPVPFSPVHPWPRSSVKSQ